MGVLPWAARAFSAACPGLVCFALSALLPLRGEGNWRARVWASWRGPGISMDNMDNMDNMDISMHRVSRPWERRRPGSISASKARPKTAQGKRPQGASPWVGVPSARSPVGATCIERQRRGLRQLVIEDRLDAGDCLTAALGRGLTDS